MNSNLQVFFDFTITLRTLLRSPKSINFTEELSTLPTDILNDASKLSKSHVKHMFPKHPLGAGSVIQVFHEDHISSVTKSMGLFVMEVLPRIINLVVKPCNFDALFLVVLRPLLFSRESALQRFQLALQLFKKLGRFYENTVAGCQKFLQTHINTDWMTMWYWVGNTDTQEQGDRCIPLVSDTQDSYLFDCKSRRDRSMQVNGDCSNFWELYMQGSYWIFLELRKQQRLELPKFLESGKAKSPFLEILPTNVQLLNRLLKNLGRNITQFGKFLLGFWQVVKLLNFVGKLQLTREDILFLNGASIYQALATIAPIFYLPKCVIVRASTDFHPLNEHLLLGGVWIDSVTVSDGQHPSIIQGLQTAKQPLNVKRGGVEPPLLNDVSPATKLSGVLALRLDISPSSSLWGSSRRIR